MKQTEFARFLAIFVAVIVGDIVTSVLVFAVTKKA